MTATALGKELARSRDAGSNGGYPGLVRSWLAEEKTVGPQMSFLVGEILRTRLPWCSGVVGLYAAGYFDDVVSLVGAVERRVSSPRGHAPIRAVRDLAGRDEAIQSASVIFDLVRAVPILGSIPVKDAARFTEATILGERANKALQDYSETFLADAFDQRDDIRIDAELTLIREVATNRARLDDARIEVQTMTMLDEWVLGYLARINSGFDDDDYQDAREDWLYARADLLNAVFDKKKRAMRAKA